MLNQKAALRANQLMQKNLAVQLNNLRHNDETLPQLAPHMNE